MEKETDKVGKNDKRLNDLFRICNDSGKLNPKAREELHELISNNSAVEEVIREQYELYALALRTRIERLGWSDALKEVLYVKCAQLMEELGYPKANQIERLAIEQIVLCWVNYHKEEILHADTLAKSHNTATGIYREKALSFAFRRYNRALEILSRMRKMNLVVQVNTANNQIISNR